MSGQAERAIECVCVCMCVCVYVCVCVWWKGDDLLRSQDVGRELGKGRGVALVTT